ncbi:MAG: hypothetical protein II622_06915, partial [Thermoguttaceae bacterium]|nr:hypothetical protein [Thermoguttaceae bacterium]
QTLTQPNDTHKPTKADNKALFFAIPFSLFIACSFWKPTTAPKYKRTEPLLIFGKSEKGP